MGLRDIGATLPPGFRFYPSDEELVCHYLFKKIANDHQVLKGTLVDIDLHTCEPWQLPEVAKLNASEWYFFSFRDRKYATGYRTNRATTTGYWKATGKDRTVHDPATKEIIGMRKTLVFYMNRAPNGIKTGWIMHEFRLESPNIPPKEDWVLCRVFHKSKGSEDNINSSPNKTSPQMMHHGTNVVVPTPPGHHETHDHNNVMASGCHQSQNSLLSLLHFSNDQTLTESTKPHHEDGDDDYGFLWDLGLEKGSLLWEEEMKPYDHHQVDSNMVFI